MSKIAFINPVGHDNFDSPIREYIDQYKREESEVSVYSLPRGPHHLEYHFYEALIGPDLLKTIKDCEKQGFAAAVIGCFNDPFLTEAREITDKMVVTAPEESALHIAATLGYKFSVLVGREKSIPVMEQNAWRYGFKDRLASFRSLELGVLDFQRDRAETERRIFAAAREAVREDGAEVIVLGCTIQFGFYQRLQKEIKVPVIDAVLASFKYAEFLVELQQKAGWGHSKICSYETPPAAEAEDWGLEGQYELRGWEQAE